MDIRILAAAATLALSSAANAQTAADTLRVGEVIGNEHGQVINGWQDMGGGYYSLPRREQTECCYSVFERGERMLVAVTVPIARGPTGGVLAERIVATKEFPAGAVDSQISCMVLWVTPLVSFRDEKAGTITSVFYDGDGFRNLVWKDTESQCEYGD